VKLSQFDLGDRTPVRLDANGVTTQEADGRDSVASAPLFRDTREAVRLERWAPHARVAYEPNGGLELFVLDGGFTEGGETFSSWSWLRLPVGAQLIAQAGAKGRRLWVKEGHLDQPIIVPDLANSSSM